MSDQQHQNFSPGSRRNDAGSRGTSLNCGAGQRGAPTRSSHQQVRRKRRRQRKKKRRRREVDRGEGGSGQFQSSGQPLPHLLPLPRSPALRQGQRRCSAAACRGCTSAPLSTSSYTPSQCSHWCSQAQEQVWARSQTPQWFGTALVVGSVWQEQLIKGSSLGPPRWLAPVVTTGTWSSPQEMRVLRIAQRASTQLLLQCQLHPHQGH